MNYHKLTKSELQEVANGLKEISQKQENEISSLKGVVETLRKDLEKLTVENKELSDTKKEKRIGVKKLESLSKEVDSLKETLRVSEEALAETTRRNEILVGARKEDKEKVEKAEKLLAEYTGKESELTEFYNKNLGQMNKMLNEQNETIVNLFDMMDGTLSLQVKYYQKYKDIFIKQEEPTNTQ